jgi:hypothetical protein
MQRVYLIKKLVNFDEEMLAAIDEWRRRQSPIPHANGAIRELIKRGLSRSPSSQKIASNERSSRSALRA